MSYPPPIHHCDTGECSARIRFHDAGPDLVYPNGNKVHYLATSEGTGGLFGLYRWEFSGARSGPGPHFHKTLSESFYVLSGVVSIFDGRSWQDAGPGDFMHVPPGGLHGFRNESGQAAAMLLHFAPGAPREAYFEGLARLAAGEKPTEQEYDAFMHEHDNYRVE